MSSRVTYRERDREYEDEPRRSYTTVKRYQIADPDSDRRSTIFGDDDVKEKIVIKRTERRDDDIRSPRSEAGFRSERGSDRDRGRDDVDVRITERTTERVTEREREPERRDISYRVVERDSDRDRGSRSEFRVVERERDVVRAPSPPEERVREYRFERERDYSPARTRVEREYDVERYSKTTDYYGQPQPPIIIRESAPQPIIIREERRGPQQIIIRRDEPQFEFIEREEVRNDQALVVKEDPPKPASTVRSVVKSAVDEKPQEEDYYYERRIREYRRNKDDIKPSDSASQYSSDDSYEYVRRERYVEDERDKHHKLHLAEGALAGAAAAGILRSHRKSQGREDNHRGRDLLGGAAIGAIGAEALSRAKSLRGSSRRREYDEEDDYRDRREDRRDRRRSRSRSRSRSQSKSRVGKLTGLAAVAAVGALAGYAIKKSGSNKETVIINDGHRRRSRSRRRHSSVGYSDDGRLIEDKHRDPEHRNRRIAQAGLASAAAAGIWERVRSKSRGGRERSKSRVRTAIPIVGAGLGGAALAGLYEKTKAGKEAKRDAVIADELGRGRGRSRSRSRSAAPRALDGRRDDPMVAYGADPVYRDYDDGPGSYRRRDRSVGSSPDTRRRSRSRGRDAVLAGGAAAAGAAIAHHAARSRSRSRNRRRDDYDDRYSDEYAHGDYITPPGGGGPNYPTSNYFPPPPTGEHAAGHDNYNAYPPYNPADYPPAAASVPRDAYSDNRYIDPAHAAAEARERQEDREMKQAARTGDAGNIV